MQFVVAFNPAPIPANHVMGKFRVSLTDAGGREHKKEYTLAEVEAAAVPVGDGSFTLLVDISGEIAVGQATLKAQMYSTQNAAIGSPQSIPVIISLEDGVWFPQPTSLSLAAPA